MREPVLTIRGLQKRFSDKAVLRGLDLTVPTGSIYGFIGANGAGKTTAMRAVLGLLRPDAGEMTVAGERVCYGATPTNRHIGYLPDVPAFDQRCLLGQRHRHTSLSHRRGLVHVWRFYRCPLGLLFLFLQPKRGRAFGHGRCRRALLSFGDAPPCASLFAHGADRCVGHRPQPSCSRGRRCGVSYHRLSVAGRTRGKLAHILQKSLIKEYRGKNVLSTVFFSAKAGSAGCPCLPLYLHGKPVSATRALNLMSACLPRQTECRVTVRAGTEDVVGSVGGHGGLVFRLSAKFALEAEISLVFLAARRYIAGEKAEHRPYDKAKAQDIQHDGYDGKDRIDVAQNIQDSADKEQDHLGDEQRIVEVVGAVASVQKPCQFLTEFVSHIEILYM